MKLKIISGSVFILFFIVWSQLKAKDLQAYTYHFVTSRGDLSVNDFCPIVDENWITDAVDSCKGKEYDRYYNLHFVFADKICHDVYEQYKYYEKGESHYEFLCQLNDVQKMYFSMLTFEGQVDNGGIYQFWGNYPELAIISYEAMRKAKLDRLSADYENALFKILGKFDIENKAEIEFNINSGLWSKKWNLFVEGDQEIHETDIIEEYYYNEEYLKEYHSKMAQFVIDNKDQFLVID